MCLHASQFLFSFDNRILSGAVRLVERTSFFEKTGLLSLISILLYLPLNVYAHQIGSVQDVLRALLFDGTFYHLWYFPAVLLGVLICLLLLRGGQRFALIFASLLYLVGLGGDSYYGLFASFPAGKVFYDALFHVFSYTRNGLFFAPIFLLLGGSAKKRSAGFSFALFLLSLCGMSAEAFLLCANGVPRHDSMTLLLPACAYFLFTSLLSVNAGRTERPAAFPRRSLWFIRGASFSCGACPRGREPPPCLWRTASATLPLLCCWQLFSPLPGLFCGLTNEAG